MVLFLSLFFLFGMLWCGMLGGCFFGVFVVVGVGIGVDGGRGPRDYGIWGIGMTFSRCEMRRGSGR